jgi:hypothetical protein
MRDGLAVAGGVAGAMENAWGK